jgi:hypothetical protein
LWGERGQRTGELVATAGDVVGSVRVLDHDQRDIGGDARGGLGGDDSRDLDPPLGDQVSGVLAGAGQSASDELRVQA